MRLVSLFALLFAATAAVAADVEGYVYTLDGMPVAKATVVAGKERTTTGDDGHFKVTAPADSLVNLEVSANALPTVKRIALAGDPPLTITLTETPTDGVMRATATTAPAARAPRASMPATTTRNRVISGSVRIGKRTLSNAPVTIHGMSEIYVQPFTVTTDDKGRYRANVAPGRYFVSIGEGVGPRLRSANEGRMYTPDMEMQSTADVTRSEAATVDIELVAAPLLVGRVVDAEDKPVGRADVLLALAGRSALEFFHEPIVRTLPDGRFALPAPAFPESETVEIVVTPPRHSPTRSKSFVLAQPPKETLIKLPKFEDVTVRVTDREGKPLTNATIAYALGDETTAFGGDAGVLLMPHVSRRRIRATNGEVALRLAPAAYEFAATAPKYQARTEERTINRAVSFDMKLDEGFAIRGRVRRGQTPVEGVHVTIRGGQVGRGERAVQTDAKGEFTFDSLPRGAYLLAFFRAEELIDRTMNVEAPGTVDLDLPPTGVLTGRVVDATSGEPVAQFGYVLEAMDAAENESRLRGRQMQRAEASADGTFTTTIPIGTYRVIASASGYLPSEGTLVRVVEREPASVEIALSRGATVTGRVTDEEGKPLLEANVVVAQEVGNIGRSARSMTRVGPTGATTGEDGTFTITGVETGPAQLIVRRSGYAMQRKAIEVEGETRVDITLSRGLSMTGIVTLGGKPVKGVSVDASTSAINADHQSTLTDERGRFTLDGLIAARYTINANYEQHHAQLDNVDVAQRREVTIELEGKGRGIILGTVSGLPRSGGKVLRGTVYAQASQVGAEGAIDAAGNYRIENAPAGTVDVVAHVETQQGTRSTAKKRVEIAPGQTTRVDLDLTPALLVSGRVTHGASKPVSRAHIVFNNESAGMVSAVTREDGTYEVGLPAPGLYQIFANAEELMSRHYQTVREFRGSETFDIQLNEQTVEGVVLDANTTQPIANALVTLVPKQAMQTQMPAVSAETITDASGRFTMTTAAQGPHLLIASAGGYAQRAQDVSLGGGTPVRAQFELAGASDLRVRIVDAKTRTPLEAHLVIADEKGHFLPVRATRSPDGTEFVFSLAPGKYVVIAISMGYPEKRVEVTAPGTITVQME